MQNTAQALRDLALGPQHNRQVQISFPDDNAPDPILLPNAFEAVEALSKDFTYKIDLLSDKDKLAPKDFIGKRVTISLARGDGSSRYFNGHIFAFRHVRTDGGWVFYEAHVGPWLRYLKYSQHNRLFLDQNLHDQTATVFQDYGVLPDWAWQVGEDDPRMTMACQFDEDDHNYLHRRWEHAGYLYWYEHTAKSHKLTVSDPTRPAPAIDGKGHEIRFHNGMGAEESDSILSWSPFQQTTSTHAELSRFDFKTPTPTHVQTSLSSPEAALPQLE